MTGCAGRPIHAAFAPARLAHAHVDKLTEDRLVGAPYLTTSATPSARLGLGPGLETQPVARLAEIVLRDLDVLLDPEHRLLECEGDVRSEVDAALGARPPPRARAPKKRVEDVFEPEAAAETTEPAIEGGIDASVAEAIVGAALVSIAQHLVGLVDLFELVGRARRAVAVRDDGRTRACGRHGGCHPPSPSAARPELRSSRAYSSPLCERGGARSPTPISYTSLNSPSTVPSSPPLPPCRPPGCPSWPCPYTAVPSFCIASFRLFVAARIWSLSLLRARRAVQ